LGAYRKGLEIEAGGETMKRIVLLLFFIALFGACATTYTHPTKNLKDFERDKAECEVIARKSLAARGVT
jgi:hypothetical protein